MKVADIGSILTLDQLRVLKANGIDAMAPYIDPWNAKGGAWLNQGFGVIEQYLRDIYAAGLTLAFFFSQTTGGSGDPGYFTDPNGRRDAGWANDFLAHMKSKNLVPPVSDVLYTADINLNPPSLFDPYANGIDPNSGGAADPGLQNTGVYGYQALIDYARANYGFMGKHLVQTYGRQNGTLEAWQHLQTTIQGITIDVDDDEFGTGWSPEEDMETPQQTYDRIADLLQERIVAPQVNTNLYFGGALADQAAAIRQIAAAPEHATNMELATALEKVAVSIEKVANDIATPTPTPKP